MIHYLFLINITAFAFFCFDKNRARRAGWRVPNARLMALAVVGGSLGALLGMYLFRHKTQQKLFTVGVPVVMVVQILIVIWFFR
ncbi:DUF1294 domain-containing protein [Fundicoccus sp. Sow4_H7]|uniref:DUF1294 domain-containing protein n=1 Tax=Fundicoccus sp. Sow4_H7 TaxID=3438784 RepID=UPI003F93734D